MLATILGTLTLPYFVVVIPQFVMVARDFGLDNTWFALIVPPLFNSLGVLFMRQSFLMMPAELFDAARVEGVKEWRIFLFVAMPLARPTLAALSIILFLHSWNNYLWPLLINSRPEMMTAPVALGSLIGLTKVSWGGIMTGAVMLTAPMLVSLPAAAAPFHRRHRRRRGQVTRGRSMAGLSLKSVVKRFGTFEIIHGASLDVEDGEFVVFVGPSGCGKSTLLRMIAGLEDISGGEISIGGARRQRCRAGRPRHRHGVPVLCALPAHDASSRTCPSACA